MMGKVEIEFNNLLGELNDDEFWVWVRDWLDEDLIMNIIRDWDDDTKEAEIENIKKILGGKNNVGEKRK